MTQENPDLLNSLKQTLRALKKATARISALEAAQSEPVAVIGVGCRFPGGGDNPEAFWRALTEGVDAIREVPRERWPSAAHGDPTTPRWVGTLDRVDGFEPAFFGISPREAASMDPQQRLLLEVSWEALEDAGHPPDSLSGSRAGIFLGLSSQDYGREVTADPGSLDAYATTGNSASFAAGRLSYVLGLQGPSMVLDTACSSSLVAVHLACQSLRNGESDLALAGGVNLILSPLSMQLLARTQALSPDGRCRAFDAAANGFVRGEGCGVVVLKRLSDARRDGDRVLACILGSAVNQDGRSTGLTAPNVLSQQALLRQALKHAKLDMDAVSYIETHGTGTPLGDPIEFEALKEVFGKPRADGGRSNMVRST